MRRRSRPTADFRLNILAGPAVRFEPGDTREVELVALAGRREVYGLNDRSTGRYESIDRSQTIRGDVRANSRRSDPTRRHRSVYRDRARFDCTNGGYGNEVKFGGGKVIRDRMARTAWPCEGPSPQFAGSSTQRSVDRSQACAASVSPERPRGLALSKKRLDLLIPAPNLFSMRPSLLLALVAGSIPAALSDTAAQTASASPSVGFEQRVRVEVLRDKKTRIQGGDFDDKTDRISFTLKLLNTDTRAAFEGCQGEFYVFAQSILNRKAYQLLGSERFEFSLPPRGTHSFTSSEVVTRWDSTDARFGAKYDAWVLVVRDKEDKVICKKSSSPGWLPVAERMNSLSANAFYDRTLNPIKGQVR